MSSINPRPRWVRGVLGACALAALAAPLAAQTSLGVDTAGFDRSVRPQDDFYQFVNGTWLRNNEIPADRSTTGSFIALAEESERNLRAILEAAASAPSRAAGSDQQKLGDLYASFMDSARIEQLGITPVQGDLQRIRAIRDRAQLASTMAQLRRAGVGGGPFGAFVQQDPKQSDRYAVSMSQAGLGLPDRDYYLNDRFASLRQGYQTYITTLLQLSGAPDPAGAAGRVLALETEIAKRQWDRTRNRDRNATYNMMSVDSLAKLAPGFPWAAHLREAGLVNVREVIVRQPSYFQGLDSLMASTPVDTWKEYLTVRLLDGAAPYLSSPFQNAAFAFRGKTLQGLQENRPRWKRGIQVVEGTLGEMLGKQYVEAHFRPEARARMQQLVANLMQAFNQGIDGLEWMSPATRAQAHDKLSKFTVKIGYPDKWRDYSAIQIRRDDLLGNLRRASAAEYERNISRLGKPVDRTEWGMTPQTVNAYYNSSNNEIVFPAAILQPPFFNPDADDAVNYGAIGAVIGHEISHGFDDQGRKSDGLGNLRDWWTAEDAAAFEQRATALADQYSGYSPLQGMNINGRLTLGENIGDLSGLAVAYRAYKLSLNGKEAPVIGGFTGDQRFFLGWAQVWRSKFRDEALRERLTTDPHSPGQYRTNGVLVNSPEFYAAFGVKEGDKMYVAPEKRVKIW